VSPWVALAQLAVRAPERVDFDELACGLIGAVGGAGDSGRKGDRTLAVKSVGHVDDFLSPSFLACPLRSLSFVLRKTRGSCSVQHSICAKLRVKCARFAASKKVMSFVFKYFLALFPLFLYFSALPQPGNFEPCCIPPFQSPTGTSAVSKSSNCAFKARISQSI